MARKRRGEDYKFLQIVDAMSAINQRVNLIGVVIQTSIPNRSRGTDCFCTLSIMDESRPSPGISVNIFAENMGKLPQVKCNGDIIQLSNVVMKTHGSEVYALFNKKFSSFALFEGKHGTSLVPYQVSSKFHGRDQDKKLIADLRGWLVDKQLDTESKMADSSRADGYDITKDPNRKARSNDPGWKYGFWPDIGNKDLVQCILCGKKCHLGIKRLKQHLAGNFRDVAKCSKTTIEIMREMQAALNSKKRIKPIELDDNVDEVEHEQSSTTPSMASSVSSNTIPKPQSNTVESLLRMTPEEVVEERHCKFLSQTTLENHFRTPEEKERVHMHIANFFYECGTPFNAANARSFEVMIESIGQYGPGLKSPTYHDLRVPLLEKAKKQTDKLKEKLEVSWKRYGCTLVLDGWTNRKGRHLLNFLVSSLEGTYFMGSVDASSQSQDAKVLADLLDSKIEEIGPEYVVQVVTKNATNYKAACHLLMEKRPSLFWTPCVAHCLDLMLEDLGKLKQFQPTITNARRITTFIYRHGRLLNAMRDKTNGRDLVIPGITRFATTFLTLQSLCKYKDALRHLFISEDWTKSKLSTTEAGKKVCDIVISTTFWHVVDDCIRASQPLLVVLRIVNGEETSSMPEVSVAMECAMKNIKESFDNKPRLYKKVIDIVERRWESQIEQKLYGAALFLNPRKYFDIKEENLYLACKLRDDFNNVLAKMVSKQDLLEKISNLADNYDASRDKFAGEMMVRQRKSKNPLDWWNAFAGCALELAKFAMRILGLCCSSFGYERNWNTFEFIHTKKRNRLEHKLSSDLVYIQYNQKISRFQKRRKLGKSFDSLVLDDFDWDNEWVNSEANVVHPEEDLIRVDRATGASNAIEGHNFPRRVHGCTNTSDLVNYTQCTGGSTSRESSSNSDYEVGEEESIPIDDEDVEDDYGQRPSTPLIESNAQEGDGDELILDEFVL